MLFLATVYINGVIAAELKSVAQCVSAQEQKLEVSREDVPVPLCPGALMDKAGRDAPAKRGAFYAENL